MSAEGRGLRRDDAEESDNDEASTGEQGSGGSTRGYCRGRGQGRRGGSGRGRGAEAEGVVAGEKEEEGEEAKY